MSKIFRINIGKFSESSGSINLSKDQLNKLHNELLKMRLKYTKEKITKYVYNNLELIINNDSRILLDINEISSSITPTYCVRELEEKNCDIHEFPILDKYDVNVEQNIQVFIFNNDIKILLIQEQNSVNYVELECNVIDKTLINNIHRILFN